jgi:alkylation response protein AidB-like acyl-CoA dehydrogenase
MTTADLQHAFTPDQLELSQIAQAVLQDVADESRAGADLGWFGVGIAEEQGGSGGSLSDLAVIVEAIGASTAMTLAGWTAGLVAPILLAATEPHAEVLGGLLSGTDLALIPVGSPPAVCDRMPVREGMVSGSFVALGDPGARYVLVPVNLPSAGGVFLFDSHSSGLDVTPIEATDPTRAYAQVHADGLRLDASVTSVTGQQEIFDLWIARMGLLCAIDAAGAARSALERTIDYANSRHQFRRAIGSFQAYKHRCASAFIELRLAQSIAMRAAAEFDETGGLDLALAAAVCAPASAALVCGEAIQLHGGIGFTWEAGLHRHLKRAKADQLMSNDDKASTRLMLERRRSA